MKTVNWERKPLGAVADLCLGKMLDQNKNRGEPLSYLANVNVRWGEFELNDLRTMRFEPKEMDRYGLKFGDIVMYEGGEPGRCAIWRDQIPGMMIQKAIHRIRPKEFLDYRFLFYSFLHLGNSKVFDQYFTGATIKHLPGENLAKVEVDIPPLPIQQRIAGILSAYDELIENSQRRIKILEAMARALYREWFVRFRFPGHESVPRVPSPLGEIPQGWEVGVLGDLVQFKSGFAFKTGTFVPEGQYRLVTIKNVQDGWFLPDSDSRLDEFPEKLLAHCILENGDILLSLTGNVGRVCLVFDAPLLLNQRVSKLVPTSSFDWAFVYCAFRDPAMRSKLEQISNGVAQQNLSPILAARMECVLPPKEVREEFSRFAAPTIKAVVQLYAKIQNLRRTRDLLLPRLLSGQIDVDARDHA
ncbi:type I restriction enzyme, S subunit [Gammaproteobacteria bacterium]